MRNQIDHTHHWHTLTVDYTHHKVVWCCVCKVTETQNSRVELVETRRRFKR